MPAHLPPEQSLISVAEAARRLGASPRTVFHWIHAGLLPATRVGLKRIFVDPGDLAKVKQPIRPTGEQPRTANAVEVREAGTGDGDDQSEAVTR